MKLKIYQQGGGLIYTPFIPEQSAPARTTSRSSQDSDEDSKLDPLDKELLSLMKGQDLLPSDIGNIYDKVINFQRRSQNLTGLGNNGYRSIMPAMLQIMQLVETAKINSEEWKEKVSEIQKHDAGSEVAMDSYGRMWVNDSEKGLKLIKPSEFDLEKHTPISNSQLIAMRRRNPELAFSDAVLGDTGIDVVGAKDVREEIDAIIDKAGTIKEVNFGKIPFSQIAKDLQGEGIYKVSQKYSKADMKGFAELLYSQLSASAKHLVNANAAIGGYDKLQYLTSIISTRTDVEPDIDYQANLTKASGTGGAGGSGVEGDDKNLKERSYTEQLATGSNRELPRVTKFNPVSSVSLFAYIQNLGGMKMDDGITPVKPGMIDAISENAGWLKEISGQYSVTFGDQIIDETAQGQLMYDGSSVQRVKMPYKEENGEITVDWQLEEELENINKQIKNNSATPGMIQEFLQDHPDLYYNQEIGLVEAINSKWFLTFGAIIGDDFVSGLDLNSRYIESMNDEKSEFWQDKYKEAIEYGFVNHGSNDKKRTDVAKDTWGWFSKNRLYHGNVFVPINLNLAGAKEFYPAASHRNNMQTAAMNERDAQIQQDVMTKRRDFNW